MEQRTCPRCGECFAPNTHNQKYCSRQCGKAVENAKRRGTTPPPKVSSYYCIECGKHCVKGQNVVAHASKFCSPVCKRRNWKKRNEERVKPLKLLIKSEGTTTQILRWKSLCATYNPAFWKPIFVRRCRGCGVQVTSSGYQRFYCSTDCKAQAKRRRHRRRYPENRKSRARAKKYGVIYQSVPRNWIGMRDGNKCQKCGVLCRTDVDMNTHPLARHIDHIVPISKGGSHAAYNLQVLCRSCNLEKSDTIDDLYLLYIASALARSYIVGWRLGTQGGTKERNRQRT